MSYCINPWCADRENEAASGADQCQTCGTPLLVQGRYRLRRPLRELDEWEPSEVFEISDEGDDGGKIKVLKVLKKESFQPQFEREVKTLQHIHHSGVPKVEAGSDFSLSVSGGGVSETARPRTLHCLVMEKIQGLNLDLWLQQNGTIDQARAIDWMGQLVEVLGQLHQENLFHRDIKLSNIMLRPTGELALIDFGTVRPMSGTYFAKISGQRDITSVVSPGYTPLEQINGKAVPQSDFYALGRSLVYLLTGQHPIDLPEDETTGRLVWRDRTQTALDDWFADLLDDMMAPFLAQRPLNATALLARLHYPQTYLKEVEQKVNHQLRELKNNRPSRSLLSINLILFLVHCFVAIAWVDAWMRNREAPPSNSPEAAIVLNYFA